ncbi:MAG: dienelactone hydrolase family protein [Alphaproteobacteria bacterium]|nr:dienelactone hydrolase family protein [Alphaproteobacteria bacterium]
MSVKAKRRLCVAWTAAILAAGPFGPASAADDPVARLSAEAEGTVHFESHNPYDFRDALNGAAGRQVVRGRLSLPEDRAEPVPAVVLVHGSSGIRKRHERYAEQLIDLGVAAFLLDSFGPRKVKTTARDQLRVSSQMMMADALAARRLLATHPKINAARIGVMGWSKGGIVALMASVDRLAGYINGSEERFAFAVVYYPFCGYELNGNDRLANPVLLLLGERDDWTPAKPCMALADRLAAAGQPIRYELYADAHHGFDGSSQKTRFGRDFVTIRAETDVCRIVIGEDGVSRSKSGGHDISTLERRAAFLKSCGVRGVHWGGNRTARQQAWQAATRFIQVNGQ